MILASEYGWGPEAVARLTAAQAVVYAGKTTDWGRRLGSEGGADVSERRRQYTAWCDTERERLGWQVDSAVTR